MSSTAQPTCTTRHVRTIITTDLHDRLAHLAVDLHVTLAELFNDGLVLLLRYHGRGGGLGEPVKPSTHEKEVTQ